MRRKSDRTASKKTKSSPEKKLEKMKRTRGRRRKHSSSSDNESTEEHTPVPETEVSVEPEKKSPQKPATAPAKEDSPEETQDQVWHVKATETSGDMGEIKKLKICLARPPSTPERADRSPRSRRKHSRATSSSDTPSVEGVEDRKKSKHRSKRSARESKEETEKSHDSNDEPENDTDRQSIEQPNTEITQSTKEGEKVSEETPMSTTNEEVAAEESKSTITSASNENTENKDSGSKDDGNEKSSDADTTVASPKTEVVESGSDLNSEETAQEKDSSVQEKNEHSEQKTESTEEETNEPTEEKDKSNEKKDELHKKDENSIQDSLESDMKESKEDCPKEQISPERQLASRDEEVSKTEDVNDNHVFEEAESTQNDKIKTSNENDVVERSDSIEKRSSKELSFDSSKDNDLDESTEVYKSRPLERSVSTHSTQSVHEENMPNGQAAPIVISRKRRWGSRHSKIKSQKSITISTDVLKDIIPDVKPVEFEEVIEEKKHHKRVEVSEKIERPVLPKIVIDNTENMEYHRKEKEEKDKENVKMKETHLASNRKISIVKDNESIITRPPSPPRHKQSNILYITNLVRPFTLPQLKNLLQRTGRITDNGFWIDKIKSKCFIKYETEDQAVETRHALHGVTWPVSNPKTLQVDFSTQEAFDKAKLNEDADNAQTSTIPGTVEDWLREQDMKRERGDVEKPWEKKAATREWDVGKNEKDKEKLRRDDRPLEKRRHRTPERSPEPARKFKKKEEEAPAKLLDDLFRKTKATPCIYWLPLSAETIAVKEEQRRQHMAEHERRLQELRRTHRRH